MKDKKVTYKGREIDPEFKKWWFGMKKHERPQSVLSACIVWNSAIEQNKKVEDE